MNNLIKNLSENKEYHFDKFIFYACLIDVLFLPYVWFISIPYTMPLLFLWLFCRYQNLKQNRAIQSEFRLFLIFFVLMFFSTLLSCILAPQYMYDNFVYIIQYTAMFLYYFVFLYYINQYEFKAQKFLVAFILFVVALAIVFNIDKDLYNQVVLFWNKRFEISINNNMFTDIGYRYAFIWMDANNIGYMMNAVVLYLWCNEKSDFAVKIFSLIALLFVLVSCMSNGGFLSFAICAGMYIMVAISDIIRGKYNKKIKLTPLNILLFPITVAALYKIILKIPAYLKTATAIESFDRIKNNSGDSRFEIWNKLIQNVNFLEFILIGKGGVTLVNGTKYAPHNGHFYIILGYGFIAYFIFMYLVFRKRKVTSFKKYIWIIPVLIGFTINVLLGEIKMMGIVMLLIACSSSKKYLGIQNEESA